MNWLPHAIAGFFALLSAFISYLVARQKCKTEIEMLEKRLREEHRNDLEILDRKHTQAIDLLKAQSEIKNNEQGQEMLMNIIGNSVGNVFKDAISNSNITQQLTSVLDNMTFSNSLDTPPTMC